MVKDKHNVVPFSMALLLHVVLFGSLFMVFDFGRPERIETPLAIKGTLVSDDTVVVPPEVEEAPVEEEAPLVEEPPVQEEPPPPDTSEQERLAAEEQKRLEDARIENERLQRLERIREQELEQKRLAEEAEKQRVAEEAERKRVAEEEQRKREAEAEQERKRLEAERQRQEEIDRQRLENERLRKESEAAARQAELDVEANRLAAATANAKAAYMFAIQQKIARNWVRPASAEVGLECTVNVRQLPGGEVIDVSLGRCNADETVRRSIESAVRKASPLPAPRDPKVFDRDLTLIFRPTD